MIEFAPDEDPLDSKIHVLRVLKSLHNWDARVSGISNRQSLEMAAACDRWLASRGIRTRSLWWDSQMQKRNKK